MGVTARTTPIALSRIQSLVAASNVDADNPFVLSCTSRYRYGVPELIPAEQRMTEFNSMYPNHRAVAWWTAKGGDGSTSVAQFVLTACDVPASRRYLGNAEPYKIYLIWVWPYRESQLFGSWGEHNCPAPEVARYQITELPGTSTGTSASIEEVVAKVSYAAATSILGYYFSYGIRHSASRTEFSGTEAMPPKLVAEICQALVQDNFPENTTNYFNLDCPHCTEAVGINMSSSDSNLWDQVDDGRAGSSLYLQVGDISDAGNRSWATCPTGTRGTAHRVCVSCGAVVRDELGSMVNAQMNPYNRVTAQVFICRWCYLGTRRNYDHEGTCCSCQWCGDIWLICPYTNDDDEWPTTSITGRHGEEEELLMCTNCLDQAQCCRECDSLILPGCGIPTGVNTRGVLCYWCWENGEGHDDVDNDSYNDSTDLLESHYSMYEWCWEPDHLNFHPSPTLLIRKEPLYIGLELEVAYPTGRDAVASTAFLRDMDSELFWAKGDSSVHNGYEIVSHPFQPRWGLVNVEWEQFQTLIDQYHAYPGHHSTGGHIHMSKEAFTTATLWKFMQFHRKAAAFCGAVGGRGCRSNYGSFVGFEGGPVGLNSKQLAESAKAKRWKLGMNPHDRGEWPIYPNRYVAVNLSPEETVELRYPAGTISPPLIRKNIEWADALFTYCASMSSKAAANGGFMHEAFIAWLEGYKDLYPHLLMFIEQEVMENHRLEMAQNEVEAYLGMV